MKRVLYIGLNGYAGSGKDTVAKMLSHILNYSFSDKESAWDSNSMYNIDWFVSILY